MMRLGVDTWLWANVFKEKHLPSIAEAKALGAEAIDFSINDPFVFPAAKAAALLKDYPMEAITSTALPLHCNPISPDRKERDTAIEFMKKLVDVTAQLGAKVTGGVNHSASGYFTGKLRTHDEVQRSAEHLHTVCEYAQQYGITVAMEPVKRFESHFLNTAQQALELIDIVGMPNLKVHLDTFHMNIEEASMTDAILACGDKLAHMHVVDSNRGAPGMGHIDWIGIFKALKQIGYDGTACIETFNPQTLDETCMLTYLTRSFAETPAELITKGMRYLQAVQTIVNG